MTAHRSLWIKTVSVWACILLGGLATASISLVAFVSVWQGFSHIHHPGSWAPIVAGTLVFGLVLWLYVRGARALYGLLNREELLNL